MKDLTNIRIEDSGFHKRSEIDRDVLVMLWVGSPFIRHQKTTFAAEDHVWVIITITLDASNVLESDDSTSPKINDLKN